MNLIMKAITRLCNLQMDKHLKQDQHKRTVRKGEGEKEKKGGEEDGLHARQ